MTDTPASASLLDSVTDLGEGTIRAFKLLGNETRLAILLTLWEATGPDPKPDEVTFTELRNRVGVQQGSQFNYPLDKLVGPFVERTEDGYRLRRTGESILHVFIGRAGFDAPDFDRELIDLPCEICGAPTAITYREDWLYRACTECDGSIEGADLPEGFLSRFTLDPAALATRSPEELFATEKFNAVQNVRSKMAGSCSECSGSVERELVVCEDHDPDGICEASGRTGPIRARFTCEICKDWDVVPVDFGLIWHPTVTNFYKRHGYPLHWDVGDFATLKRVLEVNDPTVELHSHEPLRVRVTFSCDGDELRLLLDEDLRLHEAN